MGERERERDRRLRFSFLCFLSLQSLLFFLWPLLLCTESGDNGHGSGIPSLMDIPIPNESTTPPHPPPPSHGPPASESNFTQFLNSSHVERPNSPPRKGAKSILKDLPTKSPKGASLTNLFRSAACSFR